MDKKQETCGNSTFLNEKCCKWQPYSISNLSGSPEQDSSISPPFLEILCWAGGVPRAGELMCVKY